MSIRAHAADATNAAAAGTIVTAAVQGWTIQHWSAVLGVVYLILLIVDKLGLLDPVKGFVAARVRLAWRIVWGLPRG